MIEKGDVVQLKPTVLNQAFACCFMTVTKANANFIQGNVQMPGSTRNEPSRCAFYRANMDEFDGPIGRAVWVLE